MFSNGSCDIYLTKFDSLGELLWLKQAGSDWWDEGWALTLDSENNIYITGTFVDTVMFGNDTIISYSTDGFDIFLAKYDNDSNQLWVKKCGGNLNDVSPSIVTDQYDNAFLAGRFQDTAYFDNDTIIAIGDYNTFLAKYNSAGELIWIKTAGSYVEVNTMTIDDQNNCYIAGGFKNTANFDGITIISVGNTDIFIAKYNSFGNIVWIKRYGGSSNDRIISIKCENAFSLLFTGFFEQNVQFGSNLLISNGEYDIYIAKCDTSGNILWANSYGGSYFDLGKSVDFDSENNIYLLGEYQSLEIAIGDSLYHVQNQTDIFVAKFNSIGDFIWTKNATSDYSVVTYSMTVNNFDDILFTGGIGENTTFGDTSITSKGSWDIFIAKLTQDTTDDVQEINNELSFSVYPNPAVDYFFIEHKNIFEKGIVIIKIVDISGRTIKEFEVGSHNYRIIVNISGINPGLYYLNIYSIGNKPVMKKLLISK